MNFNVWCFFLVYLNCVHSRGGEDDDDQALESRKKILDQLTRTRTVLLDGYHLVTRNVATDVHMYRSYRTVSVLNFPVLRDVTDAYFTFQAEELHLNTIGSCSPEEVIVNLKHGSYPALNPDGYAFPKHFIDPSRREEIYTIDILSNGNNKSFSIQNPKPGNWYGIVYIKWEDPKTAKVEQQGLVAICQTILYSDLQVKRDESIQQVNCYYDITIDLNNVPKRLKCMSRENVQPVTLNITLANTSANDTKIRLMVQANSLPKETDNIISCSFDPKLSNVQTISFLPYSDTWHYITLDFLPQNYTHIADCESYSSLRTDNRDTLNESVSYLMRDDTGRFFTFEYVLPTTDIQDATSLINLTSSEIQSVKFSVNQYLDIGGTVSLDASLIMSMKYYMGYRRELKNKLLAFTENNQFMKVVICLDIGHTSVPTATGTCLYNDVEKPALFVLNSTDSETIYDRVLIPYPESGEWYLTFRLFCDEVVCPCATSENGTEYYVKTSDTDVQLADATLNATREGETECNVTVLLSVSSASCVAGRCSNHGSCLLNTVGGVVVSFCSCTGGYGGWDCSDDSRMDSHVYMLLSVLLLTLSNLLFFIAIYVAIIRRYYIEGLIYTFTMVFSTFYHACDAPVQVAYCIARGNVLQFGDFYCGLMSFWMTLLAMSVITDSMRSSLQLTGAIVIALLTTWNMHSVISFLLPVAVGVVIVFTSWYWDKRRTTEMRYIKTYYYRYFPIGLILVAVGLVCYAFLQTEQNYMIVHSVWHMIIATCVVFLLPDAKRGEGINPFLPSSSFCRLPFFRRNQTAINESE